MNPYRMIDRNHNHFAHMARIEHPRHDHESRPDPLDDLISSAALKVVNAVERGWRRVASSRRGR